MERPNLYLAIHKGLRAFMAHILIEIGQVDPQDMEQSAAAAASLHQLLEGCLSHLTHENEIIHRAMESRKPGSAARLADEHDSHVQHIAILAKLARTAEHAPPDQRDAEWRRLYYQLSLFVAENYDHMLEEETQHMDMLWQRFDDRELMHLHGGIMACITPEEMEVNMRWMVPNLNHGERAQMFAGKRRQVSADEFSQQLSRIKPLLPEREWAKLERVFGL